jgi:CDP-diacylglycerol pyrophosphatase
MRRWRGTAALVGLIVIATAATIGVSVADRLAIWNIVHDKCVPEQKKDGKPTDCAEVDIADGEDNGVAILKDRRGVAQHLAIPTRRIAGIESPELLDPSAPNYWRAAWAARQFLNERLHHELPRDAVGLAINAATQRSQDQLHIHIDCVAADVRATLSAYDPELGADWHVLPFTLHGRRYWARRLDSADLSDAAPFRLLADGVAGAKGDMAHETLVVIGATFASSTQGFMLLADHADLGGGHGEDLLDSDCKVAGAP